MNAIGHQPPGALVAGTTGASFVSADGEIEEMSLAAAARRAQERPLLMVHAPATARRLKLRGIEAYDLLELYAFVHPALFCLPTPAGLARALGVAPPVERAEEAALLPDLAALLLRDLDRTPHRAQAQRLAALLTRGGWAWGIPVLRALGEPPADRGTGLGVWDMLPEWEEAGPTREPLGLPVSPEEARTALAGLLDGDGVELRPTQSDYAASVAGAFGLRAEAGSPEMVLAEAGTGTGKTLGYLAPARAWAQKNRAPVWISTYTKALQRQLDRELGRLYPDPAQKARRAVIRKGRENYLCLLNFEELARGAPTAGRQDLVALALTARWAAATRDGDMVGGDFPSWGGEILGAGRLRDLVDRRGECVHSACPHYRKCFIERSRVRARTAEIVVANHALVLTQAARAADPAELPTHYVFDEGHHLFHAADSAFGAVLSGVEASEMRRWLRGHETGHRRAGRGRGLERRIGDVLPDEAGRTALDEILRAAAALPAEGWPERVRDGATIGPVERFLADLRRFVEARAADRTGGYDLEALAIDPPAALLESAKGVEEALGRLRVPLDRLRSLLLARMDDEAAELDTPTRQRIEAAARGLETRAAMPLRAWSDMLRRLGEPTPPEFVDWCAVSRDDGRVADVGLHRRWVDPTLPLAQTLFVHAQGVVVTSATLRDGVEATGEKGWQTAEVRTGAAHLVRPPRRMVFASPFDYAAQSRVFIVTDVRRDRPEDLAAAYRALFLSAGGGALGLFTAVERLKRVQAMIAPMLDQAGLRLYAQHVDAMDVGTLIDIFRAEEDACLLGTDAVRDGVDVPGRSLRLIAFDRVPWPRPDLLHRARREAFGGQDYDDMLIRLKLRQAFGRLIRKKDDRGVFVLLDAMTPSRLLPAFPEGAPVARVGLAEAVSAARDFLGADGRGAEKFG